MTKEEYIRKLEDFNRRFLELGREKRRIEFTIYPGIRTEQVQLWRKSNCP